MLVLIFLGLPSFTEFLRWHLIGQRGRGFREGETADVALDFDCVFFSFLKLLL